MNGTVVELVFEAANLAVLGAGLWWLLFRPVRRALDAEGTDRAAREAALKGQEEDLARQSAELTAERKAHAETVEEERGRALAAAREEAQSIVDAARDRAARDRAAWDEERTQLEAEAVRTASASAAEVAAQAARGLLERIDGPELDHALARTAVGLLPQPVASPVWVEVAVPVDDTVRGILDDVLPSGFDLRVCADLGAGLRIGTPDGLIDCSAAGMARGAVGVLHG